MAPAKKGVVALLGLALGCAPKAAPVDRSRPIELVVATDAETLDPRYAIDAVSMRATRLVHAGLLRLDPETLAPVPYAAASFRWLDDRTLRLELRQDVRFQTGAPLEAEDVRATIAAFASPAVGSRHARVVEPIARVDADGPHAVVVTLKRSHATLLTDLEIPVLRRDQAASPAAPDGSLDGLGPYRVERASRGEVVLVARDGGALPRPAHDVVIRTVHDENARALRLHAGRADAVLNVSPTLLPAMASDGDLAITGRPGANLTYLVLRVDRGPFADVHVRRALSLGIDRELVTRTLFARRATPARTLLPPGHWARVDAAPLPFDRDAARRELGSVGTVRATLLTSTDRLRQSVARFLAQELRAVGIELDVVPIELGTLLARLAAGDFDVATMQLPELTEPNVLRVFLHSASIPPAGSNRGRVRDDVLDALLDEGERTLDVDVRRGVYARLDAHARDTLPIVPLWHEDQVVVTSARARLFRPSAEGRWLGLALLR